MERDLEAQLELLLDRMCSEQHVTEAGRVELKRWFVETLETERRGWKGRLKDAVRAVDNEHRLTLAAHTTIQQIIALMVNRIPATVIASVLPDGNVGSANGNLGEVDGGSADDTDKKTDRLVQLEQYWSAVTKYLDSLEQERTECLRVLGLDDADDVDLKAEIESRLGDMDKESSRKTAFQQLTSENGELRDRLRSVVRSARVTKERYEKEQTEMKKLMTTLEQRVLIQNELIDRLSGRIVRQEQAVQTDQIVRRVPPARQHHLQSGPHPLGPTTSNFNPTLVPSATSNSLLEHQQRPQSSASSLLPAINPDINGMVTSSVVRNSDEFYRKYALQQQQQQQRQGTNSSTAFPPVSTAQTHNEVSAGSGTGGGGLLQVVKPTQSQTTAVVLPNIIFATTTSGMTSTSDVIPATVSEPSWTPYSPNYLRGQVVNFASKLEETKREMDACQRELIRLKAAAFGAMTSSNYVSKDFKKRQRLQKQALAAKSVTTLHLPPVTTDQMTTPRSLHGNETSRETQSTWRLTDGDSDNHYSMYARRPKNISGRHWRA